MGESRSALIVAIHDYDDVGLTRLKAPARDAEALSEVLADPEIGGFEVRTVINQPAHVVNVEVAAFFANRKPDELLLVHFSCHGVKDDSGELYFATTDTRLDLLEASAVSSAFVNKVMNRSRSSRVVLFLDCCYAGAFARGMATRASPGLDIGERLGGRGRAVLTASTALQFAFEGTDLASGDVEQEQPSVFTRALVSGLRTGEADRDLDGMVSLDELYGYMYDEVTASTPHQTPGKWVFGLEGDLYVARRSTPVTTPSELEKEIVESVQSSVPWQRSAVVPELERVLRESHPGRALAARQALERLADDDSRQVAVAARNVLVSHVPAPRSPSEQFTVVNAPSPAQAPEPLSPSEPAPTATPVIASTGSPELGQERPVASATVRPTTRQLTEPLPPIDPRPSRRRPRLLIGAIGLGVLTVLVGAGWWLWADRSARLPESTLLVSEFADNQSRLVAVDTRTGDPISDFPRVRGRLPSISPDRRWVIYVGGEEATKDPFNRDFLLFRMRPDGSQNERWLEDPRCPYAGRPTWNPSDPGELAVMCYQSDNTEMGIWKVDAEGQLGAAIVEDELVRGDPTWTDHGTVVYAKAGPVDDRTTLWEKRTDGADAVEARVDGWPVEADISDWSANPDWSERGGLLFTRSPEKDASGRIYRTASDGFVALESAPDQTRFATWAPDGRTIAWLSPDGAPNSFRLQLGGDESRSLNIMGRVGGLAWGSR